jgi:hypothetical protein
VVAGVAARDVRLELQTVHVDSGAVGRDVDVIIVVGSGSTPLSTLSR